MAADGSPGSAGKRLLCSPGLVSTTYTKLERGNLSGVSDSVLDAIANALQLDETERAHLANLARASNPVGRPRRRPSSQPVRAPRQQILVAMPGAPAYVRNGRRDILAANRLGCQILSAHPRLSPSVLTAFELIPVVAWRGKGYRRS